MLIATDPLSLSFIGCFLFGLLFLLAVVLLGNLGDGHGMSHVGHSALHQLPLGSSAHVPHVHAHTHAGQSVTAHTHHHAGQDLKGHPATANHTNTFLGYINPTAIVLFLLWFGFFGYLFHNTTQLALPITVVLALVGGVIFAGIILSLLSRMFANSEGSTVQDISNRTGLLGKVNISIQEGGVGEIIYISPGGFRKSIPARSVDGRRIERDQDVVVVNSQDGIAVVDTWDRFIGRKEQQHEPLSMPNADNSTE
ncbi:MAG: hypothetical protein E6J34_04305 [Chloroflexi bacterium]|nr:MAG: hypothetical protein E6J34_04305 [Chloroflexota bacterium]